MAAGLPAVSPPPVIVLECRGMKVRKFMIPVERLIVADRQTPIQEVAKRMVDNHISSVIVVRREGDALFAEGVITKTDILRATFTQGLSSSEPAEMIMSTRIVTINADLPRDAAAEEIMKSKVHHLVVVGEHGHLVGIVSAWDIAREVTLDGRAWPYNREFLN